MCIVSGPVQEIAKTEILVARGDDGRQLTVYSNRVKLFEDRPVAMILPYPRGPVEVVRTNASDAEIFSALRKSHEVPKRSFDTFGGGGTTKMSRGGPTLEVRRSGAYRYSIAPTVADLERADEAVFDLSDSALAALLSEYAERAFSFIVCRIDDNVDYAPFAYRSLIVNENLFVPTKHYHGGSASTYHGDWDHIVYVLDSVQRCLSWKTDGRPVPRVTAASNGFKDAHDVQAGGALLAQLPSARTGVPR